MGNIADILGIEAVKKDPKVAVLRCNGSCEFRPQTNDYDGAVSCAVAASLYGGTTGCQYGCLGCGDCEASCKFDALHMNPLTGLPEVIDDTCVSCGACVKACPKNLFELRRKAPKDRKIYVACRNEDKGGIARKTCSVACIGCSKCEKECKYEAITMANNLAFIDADKCKLCRKCVSVCPTNSIIEVNFPPRKITLNEQPLMVEKVTETMAGKPANTSEI